MYVFEHDNMFLRQELEQYGTSDLWTAFELRRSRISVFCVSCRRKGGACALTRVFGRNV